MSLSIEHALEVLESRVLLSADGFLASAVAGNIPSDHFESQAIVETVYGEHSNDHWIIQTTFPAKNSLVEIFGNAEDLTFGPSAVSATPIHEKMGTGTAQQESVSEVVSVAVAKNDSLSKARFVSCDALTSVDCETTFSTTDEMVATLRAGNGPPQVVANKSLSLCSGFSSIKAEMLRFRGAGWVSSLSFSDFITLGLTSFGGIFLVLGLVQEPGKRKSKTLEPFVSSAPRCNEKRSNRHSRKKLKRIKKNRSFDFFSHEIIDAQAIKTSNNAPFRWLHKLLITLLARCGHAFKLHLESREQRGLKFGSEWKECFVLPS